MDVQADFERSLSHVLVHEGLFSDHPDDPGGATMRGVTQRTYDVFRQTKKLPKRSVRMISEEELRAIYKREYWDRVRGDDLPTGLSYVMFDGAVNSGVSQSVKWLQRVLQAMHLYAGQIDGMIGQGTLLAVKSVNDVDALIGNVIARRMAFLKSLKTWATFGKGWKARVSGVLKTGQAWAVGSVGPTPLYAAGGEAKALLADAKSAPTLAVADASTGGGIGAGGIAGTLKAAQEQLAPFTGTSHFIDQAVAALVIGGAVLAIGGVGWRWYAKRKKDRLSDALDLQAVPA